MGNALADGKQWTPHTSWRPLYNAIPLGFVLWVATACAICPPQCLCYDDTLTATCTKAKLEVFPIQLNPDVKNIDLSYNKISSVEYTLTFYINLLHLDLSYNKIQNLGTHNFDYQEKLNFLNISFNKLSQLGKGTFKGLKFLKLLDLSNNLIYFVEGSAFKDTVELEYLIISNNKITSFEDPDVFKSLQKLRGLYLDGNQILDVPHEILQHLPFTSMLFLNFSNNFIDIVEDLSFPSPVMGSLKQLSLSSNAISTIHRSSFNSLQSLTHLFLSDNNLTYIPTEQMSKLSKLTELDLSENMFTDVPAVAFQSLFNLKILRLCRMPRLVQIDSRAFVDNIHLETVFLDDNMQIQILPARIFNGNHHLKYVSIRKNSLTVIDASHFPVDNLVSLDVSDNPFNCNCSLLWLWTLALQEKKSLEAVFVPSNVTFKPEDHQYLRLSISNLKCDSPPNLKGKLLIDVPDSTIQCETTWVTIALVTSFVVVLSVITCVVLLLSTDKTLLFCRKSKDSNNVPLNSESKQLSPNLRSSSRPSHVLMLMPNKNFSSNSQHLQTKTTNFRYIEPWIPDKSESANQIYNEYMLDVSNNVRKPAHTVYV